MNFSSTNGKEPPVAKAGDRRVHERWAIAPRLYVILDGANSDGILNDVSEGGAALDIVGSQLAGEDVIVDFEMLEIGQHFEAKARIKWRDEALNKVGVHFVDMPEASRNQLKKWLSLKMAAAEPTQSAILRDADREESSREHRLSETPSPNGQPSGGTPPLEGTSAAKLPMRPDRDVPPLHSDCRDSTPLQAPHMPATASSNRSDEAGRSAPADESKAKTWFEPAINAGARSPESASDLQGDLLVRALVDSFGKPEKKSNYDKFTSPGDNIFATQQDVSSGWGFRRWLAVGAAVGVMALLAFGVVAYRSPARNPESINISKSGQPQNAAGNGAQLDNAAYNAGGSSGGNLPGNADGGGTGASGNPPSSQTPAAALSASALNLSSTGYQPCVNLGPTSDKIRIYIWPEKDTPQPIVAAYTKYLNAVTDVRVVDKAPYDLVLYVNGAKVFKSQEAGFIWSSRVYRAWYCGQTLGTLQQPQVNESLHYVQSVNLDQHIQAEIAYLILHTFETIRDEHSK